MSVRRRRVPAARANSGFREATPVARILIEALAAHSPGGNRCLEGLLPALRTLGVDHRIHVLTRRSGASRLAEIAGGPVEVLPVADWIAGPIIPRLFFDLFIVPLRAKLRGYDLVVTLANFGPVWSPVPHLVVQHNAMPFSEEYLGRIGGLTLLNWRMRGLLCAAEMRFATINVTPSAALAELIKSAHPSLSDKAFSVLPHGTDLSSFSPRDRKNDSPSPFIFLCPTKIETYKGMEILLEATRLLAARNDDFEVHVTAPDSGWPPGVQQRIEADRDASHFERLRFIGFQPAERMPEIYRAADAVIYPSLCESFGFPLLESMACRLPIAAGDLEVNREVCGDAARYYAVKSAEECAEAMRAVLEQPACRETLRAAAGKRLQERDWSWETNARRFLELCEAAMATGGS
jgi:glycosyltransferase involved in cell wall biosynthesis